MTERKNAEPRVADANAAALNELPFSDRQDYTDAERGFIASGRLPMNPRSKPAALSGVSPTMPF